MKKVIYVLTSLAHKRVFELFVPRDDMKQLIVGPHPIITTNIVPEDYSDFKIRDLKHYSNRKELQDIINKFNPDIYVEASLPIANKLVLPKHCKKVFVSHGMAGNHVKGLIKQIGLNTSVWKGADLYCGASKIFENWVKHVAKVDSSKIFLNAFPQLDILHDPSYYNSYRQSVLSKTKYPDAKKVLLFFGFCCKDRFDFNPHNEDYFKSVIELEKIARENDWLVMVKPRHYFNMMMKFLRTHKWGKKYIKKYSDIQDSKNLHFITTTGHVYRYFFADAIILNGTSTVEIEACAIKKPLFIVRTCLANKIDPYNIVNLGAAKRITNMEELGHILCAYFKDGSFHRPDLQEKVIKDMGIMFDGNMHNRLQNKLSIL